jgi:hypothetical protein
MPSILPQRRSAGAGQAGKQWSQGAKLYNNMVLHCNSSFMSKYLAIPTVNDEGQQHPSETCVSTKHWFNRFPEQGSQGHKNKGPKSVLENSCFKCDPAMPLQAAVPLFRRMFKTGVTSAAFEGLHEAQVWSSPDSLISKVSEKTTELVNRPILTK